MSLMTLRTCTRRCVCYGCIRTVKKAGAGGRVAVVHIEIAFTRNDRRASFSSLNASSNCCVHLNQMQVHAKIRENPIKPKKERKKPDGAKRWNAAKLTYEQVR